MNDDLRRLCEAIVDHTEATYLYPSKAAQREAIVRAVLEELKVPTSTMFTAIEADGSSERDVVRFMHNLRKVIDAVVG